MIMLISGVFALFAALQHEAPAAIACALAFGAGACEWHGASLLATGRGPGIPWMKYGELLLLAIVTTYSLWMLRTFDADHYRAQLPEFYRDWLETDLLQRGLREQDLPAYYRTLGVLSSLLVILVSVVYQGGLALYYHSKRRVVAVALEQLARG